MCLDKCRTGAHEDEPLAEREPYYIPSLASERFFERRVWLGTPCDLEALARGLVYRDRKSAACHARVLLRVTWARSCNAQKHTASGCCGVCGSEGAGVSLNSAGGVSQDCCGHGFGEGCAS